MEHPPVIKVDHLRISFAGARELVAVQDLNFKLERGKTLAIVGESGSGKSLTALALMGLLPPAASWEGNIQLQNPNGITQFLHQDISIDWAAIRGKVVSMVFQEPMSALNPVMSVGRQLKESITAHGHYSRKKSNALTLEWLAKVQLPQPETLYHRYPHQLSGGQKQRVMIAMALSSNPVLLIADEPTTALDVTVQQEIISLMSDLQKELGTAMVFITHDLALAAALADDVMVLLRGQVVEYGDAANVLQNPQQGYTKALLACRPGANAKGKKLPVVADFLSELAAPDMAELPPIKVGKEPLLKVRNLRVWFPTERDLLGRPLQFLRAVEDVSFDLFPGEVLGLVGESGCGKSTISRALMGLQAVESGKILFDGKDLAQLNGVGWHQMRKEVQMIFQDPFSSLNPRLTIGDAIQEPMIANGLVSRHAALAEAKRLLNSVQLPETALQRYPHQFSGGQRQRIGIARALALKPRLIICDESVSALDVSVQAQILNLLKELQTEFRLSYLFISHDLNVVHYIADKVVVMQKGRIVERGTAAEVLKHPRHEYTKKLVAAIP